MNIYCTDSIKKGRKYGLVFDERRRRGRQTQQQRRQGLELARSGEAARAGRRKHTARQKEKKYHRGIFRAVQGFHRDSPAHSERSVICDLVFRGTRRLRRPDNDIDNSYTQRRSRGHSAAARGAFARGAQKYVRADGGSHKRRKRDKNPCVGSCSRGYYRSPCGRSCPRRCAADIFTFAVSTGECTDRRIHAVRKGRSPPYSRRKSAGGAQKYDIFVFSHNRGPRQGGRDSDGHGHGGREDSTSSEHRRRTDNAAANKAREDRQSPRHRRAGDMRADIRAQHPARHGRAQRVHAVRQSRRCGYPRGASRRRYDRSCNRRAENG